MKYQFLQAKFAKILLFCAAFGVFFTAFVSTSQAQTTTFAQFVERAGSQDFVFTNNAASADFNTVAGGSAIFFLYQNISGLDSSLQGIQNAHLFITTTTTTPGTVNSNTAIQPLDQVITISIVRDTPAPVGVGVGTRTNLLTATISANTATPTLTGTNTGNAASFDWTTPDHVVIYTSDFLNFAGTVQRNLAFGFSSVTPIFALGANNFLQSFTAAGSGTFASNPPPTVGPTTAAGVTISGRVLTSLGRGLGRARVNIIEADGTTRTVFTNPFGYYSFSDVSAGQSAILSILSKRYSYRPQVITVTNDLSDLNFTPER